MKALEIQAPSGEKTSPYKNKPQQNQTGTKLVRKDSHKTHAADHSGSYFKMSPSGSSGSRMPLSGAASSSLPPHTTHVTMVTMMPSKDAVIKKMKKITKAVQELFRATKESDFASLKDLCEKVSHCVHEMIVLFPHNHSQLASVLSSGPLHENLKLLEDTCTNLVELIYKNYAQIEHFIHADTESDKKQEMTGGKKTTITTNSAANNNGTQQQTMSGSSSSSSAISSGSMGSDHNQDSLVLKTMIVSNLVTYSYEIAHTVKRIVCIMDADAM